jgi:hypothetical protein
LRRRSLQSSQSPTASKPGWPQLLQKAPAGSKNLRFGDLVTLAEAFGIRQARISGSHHIFEHPDVPELLNLQDLKGKTKAYQVRQFLELVEEYNLELGEDE